MNTTLILTLRLEEVCRCVEISEELLAEFVAQGIVAPQGDTPSEWRFDANSVSTLKRAVRLQRELDIDWAGVAVALDLLREVDTLRAENRMLRQRLERFLS